MDACESKARSYCAEWLAFVMSWSSTIRQQTIWCSRYRTLPRPSTPPWFSSRARPCVYWFVFSSPWFLARQPLSRGNVSTHQPIARSGWRSSCQPPPQSDNQLVTVFPIPHVGQVVNPSAPPPPLGFRRVRECAHFCVFVPIVSGAPAFPLRKISTHHPGPHSRRKARKATGVTSRGGPIVELQSTTLCRSWRNNTPE